MPSDKNPHGTTLHQGIILAIVASQGPLTSSEIADAYKETAKVEFAYNYQFIVTRRMADRGLIKPGSTKNTKGQKVLRWAPKPCSRSSNPAGFKNHVREGLKGLIFRDAPKDNGVFIAVKAVDAVLCPHRPKSDTPLARKHADQLWRPPARRPSVAKPALKTRPPDRFQKAPRPV